MKILRALFISILVLQGCDRDLSQRAEKLQMENALLRQELSDAKRELDELKFGPSGMLAEAEQGAAKGEWAIAKKHAEALLARHPASAESARAKQVLAAADSALAKAAKEAKLAEARRAEAEKQQRAKEERRLTAALGKMHKKTDTIENVTWYRDQTSPRFSNYNGFFLYIGKRPNTDPWLRLRIQYNAEDWLFIKSFLIVADGQRFEYPGVNFERDHESEIWEWYDEPATSSDLEMIKAVISSKKTVIRFNGMQYQHDLTISAAQKAALQNVLDAYKVLGGT